MKGSINAQEGENNGGFAGNNLVRARRNNDFTADV